ncbi:MAG: response regulator [Chitinophagaceae bacterium]
MTSTTVYSPTKSVLIVDDNPFFRVRMREMLDEVEIVGSIDEADGYNEAVRLLEEKKPNVVLLDIDMPGKNGICVLKLIRESGLSCRVIMISNRTEESYRIQCNELGADYFLDKSNDFLNVPDIVASFA